MSGMAKMAKMARKTNLILVALGLLGAGGSAAAIGKDSGEAEQGDVTQEGAVEAAAIRRYPLPDNSTFPIALAVETAPDARLVHHSGMVPRPLNPDAAPGTREYWGDTEAQTMSVLTRLRDSLESMGLGMGDVIKLTVFLVGDPALGGKMDFPGMMRAYTQFFGTPEQPNLPARSALQVAGLVADGMWVEIEAVAAVAP